MKNIVKGFMMEYTNYLPPFSVVESRGKGKKIKSRGDYSLCFD
jgi:hypothetical protein